MTLHAHFFGAAFLFVHGEILKPGEGKRSIAGMEPLISKRRQYNTNGCLPIMNY